MGKEAERINKTKSRDKTNKDKPKSEKKRYHLIFALIALIIVVGIFWLIFSSSEASSEARAQLIIQTGTVQVKQSGEAWKTVQSGTLLYNSDSVRTGEDTSASIVLFQSSIIRLDSNTQITIEEIIKEVETNVTISQESGRTWSTISKISGIDNYDVQTPTTVASVRGTSFGVDVEPNGTTEVGVGKGTVNVSSYKDGKLVDTINLNESWAVKIDAENIEKKLEKKPFEKDDWVKNNQKKDEEITKKENSDYIDNTINVKADLLERIEPYVPELKENFGITDQELEALIDGYLLGYYDLPDDAPQWIKDLFVIT